MERVNKIINMLENGQHKEAFTEYNLILQRGLPDEKFQLAEELYQLGFLDEARTLIENLLKIYPEEGELRVLLAEILVDSSR